MPTLTYGDNGKLTYPYRMTISAGSTYTIYAEVRGGMAETAYAATVPAGQVGVWCGDDSDNEFDNFTVRDIAGPYVIDARWFCDKGGAQIDASDSNVLELNQVVQRDVCAVRRGLRRDQFVATVRFEWNGSTEPGFLVRWLSPGDWLAVGIPPSDQKARLLRRKDDGVYTGVAWSATALSLTSSTWYTMKVVVDESGGSQRLRFWVDTDDDGSFADETVLLNTTTVDDDWSAGYLGLFRGVPSTTTTRFDDFAVGTNDGSDGFDDMLVSDDFNSTTVTLTYDDNGNLTDDGIFEYVYDAWNRLVEVVLESGGDETTIAAYEYDGKNRRTMKTVTNCGIEETPNDGGNTTVHYYYAGMGGTAVSAVGWNICETRNGSSQTTCQYVWGWQYVDELVMIDRNGDPTESNDCDPDDQSGESTADERYFVHQDRNWNVAALTDYDPSGSDEGNVVERYHYTPYGQFIVLKGDAGSGEMGNVLPTSTVGNVFAHQGLPFDAEKGSYQIGTSGAADVPKLQPRVLSQGDSCGVKVHNTQWPRIHSGYSIDGGMHDFGPADGSVCCGCEPGTTNYLPGGPWDDGQDAARKSEGTLPGGTTSCSDASCDQIKACLRAQEQLWESEPKSEWCLFTNDCVDFVDENLNACCLSRPPGWLSAEELAEIMGLGAAATLAAICAAL